MLSMKSSDLIHLISESLYPFTNCLFSSTPILPIYPTPLAPGVYFPTLTNTFNHNIVLSVPLMKYVCWLLSQA